MKNFNIPLVLFWWAIRSLATLLVVALLAYFTLEKVPTGNAKSVQANEARVTSFFVLKTDVGESFVIHPNQYSLWYHLHQPIGYRQSVMSYFGHNGKAFMVSTTDHRADKTSSFECEFIGDFKTSGGSSYFAKVTAPEQIDDSVPEASWPMTGAEVKIMSCFYIPDQKVENLEVSGILNKSDRHSPLSITINQPIEISNINFASLVWQNGSPVGVMVGFDAQPEYVTFYVEPLIQMCRNAFGIAE